MLDEICKIGRELDWISLALMVIMICVIRIACDFHDFVKAKLDSAKTEEQANKCQK
jgi:hypothetical protein